MNIQKIRIAFFTDVLKENLDGVTYTLYNIIKRVPQERIEILFITPFPPDDLSAFPFPVHVCRYVRFPLYRDYPVALPDLDVNLKKLLDNFSPDIVHFTSPTLLGRYAVNYARSRNIPLISTYHTHYKAYIDYYFKNVPVLKRIIHGLVKKIMLWFYNRCDVVLVPTRPIINELTAMGIEKSRMMLWGRGISSDEFNPAYRDPSLVELIDASGKKKILFVSRLVWEKEIRTLMHIYDLLQARRPDLALIITGDGPCKKTMQKKMPRAIFTGKKSGKELSKIYASCDVFLFPSLSETFGNVVLEAMSSGLPVVAANQGGPAGIIENGINGYLVRPKDADAFYSSLTKIVDDEKLKEILSVNAIKYAQSKNWDPLCNILFNLYQSITDKNMYFWRKPTRIAL